MTDYSKMRMITSVQLTFADRQRLDEEHEKLGVSRGYILTQALREWFASRDGAIPLHNNQMPKVIPGDVKQPVLVVPRDQYKGDGQ